MKKTLLLFLSVFFLSANLYGVNPLCTKGMSSFVETVRSHKGSFCKNRTVALWSLKYCKSAKGYITSHCYKLYASQYDEQQYIDQLLGSTGEEKKVKDIQALTLKPLAESVPETEGPSNSLPELEAPNDKQDFIKKANKSYVAVARTCGDGARGCEMEVIFANKSEVKVGDTVFIHPDKRRGLPVGTAFEFNKVKKLKNVSSYPTAIDASAIK